MQYLKGRGVHLLKCAAVWGIINASNGAGPRLGTRALLSDRVRRPAEAVSTGRMRLEEANMPGPIAAAIIAGVVGGIVVAGATEAYKLSQEAGKVTDAWKALLATVKTCARQRPDIVTCSVDPFDEDNYMATIKTANGVGWLYFEDFWYKSNELRMTQNLGSDLTTGSIGEWALVDPKEVRAKVVAELKLFATNQADTSEYYMG